MIDHVRLDDTAEWLNYLQPEGLVVGTNVLRERELSPIRQTPLDTEEAADALGLTPRAERGDAPRRDDRDFVLADPWRFLETVLRWPVKLVAGAPGGPALPADLARRVPEHGTLLEPAMALLWNGPGEDGVPAQALVALHPDLDPDGRHLFGPGEWEASPHARLERLVRESGIGVGVLIARNTLRLIYAPRGETAGWLSWPLAPLGRVEGRPMLAGLKLCLGRTAFFTGAPETRLRSLLKASREAQDKVSEKLSGQVLGALHELLRGLHRADPQAVETLAKANPRALYEGLLTCLMRLVFLLYAEDRDLLPSSREPRLRQLWESGYSIRTLYARLLADEALNPDTMDQRRGGWGQLLATFRLVHGGHPGWVTGRGGKLFDPDQFPFLEGRTDGQPREAAQVLPVSDGMVLRVLHELMTVESRSLTGERIRERLSYRALDVESIGSVYETVMGFTACRADERMIALKDEKRLPAFIGLDSLLAQKPGERQKWLKERAIKLSTRQQKGVKEATDVASLVTALGTAVDERASPEAAILPPGAPYLQPTEERRRSGSHYTPRSLTEPIVRHALEPTFARIGEAAAPEAVLALKVLDPACGSGAFLVEACRQLGSRLEQAWTMHPAEKPAIPPDEDEATHARRLVAQKCLYGVDKNPMAVDLARLSLWLATLARDHEFSFLDHALKSGDSLVGLTRKEIQAVHWDATKPGLPLFRGLVEQAVARALEGREAIRNAADDVSLAIQTARHRRVEDEVEPARIVGDAVIAAFFSAERPREREAERAKVESWIAAEMQPDWDVLRRAAKKFRDQEDWRPFHWEIEFPEVFNPRGPGFDAIVGNPPFSGGTHLERIVGRSGRDWLVELIALNHRGIRGAVDLSAYFFLKCFNIISRNGVVAFVSTNSVAQGDSRAVGLEQIVGKGGNIFRAIRSMKWPGEASTHIAMVWIAGPDLSINRIILNDKSVGWINSGLGSGHAQTREPQPLLANRGIAFEGVKIAGAGFIIDRTEAMRILAKENNKKVVFPYLSGEELNNSPSHNTERWIINFADRPLDSADGHDLHAEGADKFEEALGIVTDRVKPERMRLPPTTAWNRGLIARWWQFGLWRPALASALSGKLRCFAISRVTAHHCFAEVPAEGIVFSDRLVIVASQYSADFAVLSSRIHHSWAHRPGATTQGTTLNYLPSRAFLTFPRPTPKNLHEESASLGEEYKKHRAALMIAANEGMTKTYNRFHDPDERSPAIQRLRDLHDEMDRAVLRAYGWDDLAETLRPEFLTPETEDDHTYQGRYFWPAEQRDLVLSRLLALNAERHAEELAAGIAPVRKSRAAEADEDQDELDLT
ncbi:DNA methyltransferase [Methylorubrum populi]|uniref:site-specific DNA-methyltransferase (adenine-specific) n=1 Tax=Methylorubrum populi TaxID=223967 RepID=A0A833N1N8_9HYPH|nr:DNA methyltransferase [Methylorubrum populi]KAB7786368.1 hypothetical protein F8B43_1769 [Methylorubrum populi]